MLYRSRLLRRRRKCHQSSNQLEGIHIVSAMERSERIKEPMMFLRCMLIDACRVMSKGRPIMRGRCRVRSFINSLRQITLHVPRKYVMPVGLCYTSTATASGQLRDSCTCALPFTEVSNTCRCPGIWSAGCYTQPTMVSSSNKVCLLRNRRCVWGQQM